mgnify:FL=1
MQAKHFQLAQGMESDWKQVSDQPLDVTQEALACYWWVQHWHRDDDHDALITLWLATEGPAFTVEALVNAQKLSQEMYPNEEDRFTFYHEKIDVEIHLIRKALAFASEEVYQATLATAERLWVTLEIPYWQAVFAYLFPAHSDWAEVVATQVLQQAQVLPQVYKYLLASGLSLGSLQQVIQKHKTIEPEQVGFLASAVEMHGAALWSTILDLTIQMGEWSAASKPILMILAVFKHPAVAQYFAVQLDAQDEYIKVHENYLERHSDIGIPALEKLTQEKPEKEIPYAYEWLDELNKPPLSN